MLKLIILLTNLLYIILGKTDNSNFLQQIQSKDTSNQPNPVFVFSKGLFEGFGIKNELHSQCSLEEIFYDNDLNTITDNLIAAFLDKEAYLRDKEVWFFEIYKITTDLIRQLENIIFTKCQIFQDILSIIRKYIIITQDKDYLNNLLANFSKNYNKFASNLDQIISSINKADIYESGKEIGNILKIIIDPDYFNQEKTLSFSFYSFLNDLVYKFNFQLNRPVCTPFGILKFVKNAVENVKVFDKINKNCTYEEFFFDSRVNTALGELLDDFFDTNWINRNKTDWSLNLEEKRNELKNVFDYLENKFGINKTEIDDLLRELNTHLRDREYNKKFLENLIENLDSFLSLIKNGWSSLLNSQYEVLGELTGKLTKALFFWNFN